jgi:mycothiol synthase
VSDAPTPRGIPPAGTLRWEVLGPGTDAEMAAIGLRRVRTLVELRRPLPLDPASRAGIAEIRTRPFDPGRDTDALLEVNNAAFDWHPEQGGWDRARLAEALAQRWVDPDGLLVHDGDDGVLDGFCWTRVHTDRHLGEIWVIGAHPDRQRSGLGAALVAAGLDHLHDRGLRTVTLFTEAENRPARRMYDRMGFALHETRGGYR